MTLNSFALDVVNANGRDDLIKIFAEYKIVPKKNPTSGAVANSDYILERSGNEKPGGNRHAVGTETRKTLIRKLGITSYQDCRRVREDIKNHPRWGSKV